MGILTMLAMLMALGCFICFVIVLIKLFQTEGALHGILGLICSLYTFIWGWMNATRLNIKTIMLAWTVLIILAIILNVSGGGFAYSFGDTPTTVP
jgi:hypothetical protein